jgi:cytochrome c
MTVEPRRQRSAGTNNEARAGLASDTPQSGRAVEPGPSGTSPLRLLLVLVPLVIIVAAGTNIMGLWTTSFQQAAREERRGQPGLRPAEKDVVGLRPPTVGPGETAPAAREAGFEATAVVALLSKANPEDGASVFRLCSACHAAEQGAPHRVGPNLWGIVGHRKAAQPGFNYSAALRAKGGTWSYEDLAHYTHNPRLFAPGTSMAFVGIADNSRMASLIAYLRTLSDNPAPLPK